MVYRFNRYLQVSDTNLYNTCICETQFHPPLITTHTQAVQYFTTLIGKNVYALFFFAGHGFEYASMNYMMPVDADVEKKPEQCLCAQDVLQAMQVRGAKLSIMILDMCRVNAST